MCVCERKREHVFAASGGRSSIFSLAFFLGSFVGEPREKNGARKRAGSNGQSRHLRCAINERVFAWSSSALFRSRTKLARYAPPPQSSLLVLTSRLIYNELLFFNPGRKCQPSFPCFCSPRSFLFGLSLSWNFYPGKFIEPRRVVA